MGIAIGANHASVVWRVSVTRRVRYGRFHCIMFLSFSLLCPYVVWGGPYQLSLALAKCPTTMQFAIKFCREKSICIILLNNNI